MTKLRRWDVEDRPLPRSSLEPLAGCTSCNVIWRLTPAVEILWTVRLFMSLLADRNFLTLRVDVMTRWIDRLEKPRLVAGILYDALSWRAQCWNSRGPSSARGEIHVCRTTTKRVDWRKRVRNQQIQTNVLIYIAALPPRDTFPTRELAPNIRILSTQGS